MPLLREIVFPVCSPSLLNGASAPRNLADLAQFPLIECDAAEAEDIEFGWSTWLDRFGMNGILRSRRLRFSHFGVALSAAVDGLGVALGRSPYGGCRTRRRQARAPSRKARDGEGVERICAGLARRGSAQASADRRVSGTSRSMRHAAASSLPAPAECRNPKRTLRSRAGWMAARATRRAMLTGHPPSEVHARPSR